MTIHRSDWHDDWSADHPVQVTFGTGETAYLSIDTAVTRLSDEFTDEAARQYLVIEGQPLQRFNGSRYVLLTMDPAVPA